jgi:hypothetical protein
MKAASITARVRVDDFDAWKVMFDRDLPRAREKALGWTLYRGTEDPNEVFIRVDFASVEDATTARDRVLSSGVLERIPDHTGPVVIQQTETRTA